MHTKRDYQLNIRRATGACDKDLAKVSYLKVWLNTSAPPPQRFVFNEAIGLKMGALCSSFTASQNFFVSSIRCRLPVLHSQYRKTIQW